MKTKVHKLAIAHQVLKITWGILSACLLLIVLYYSAVQDHIQNRQLLMNTADAISDQVDSLINDLMQVVHAVDTNGRDFKHCKQNLLPALQKLMFDNPQLSGLVISNKNHHIICSTLGINSHPALRTLKPLTLFGPVQRNKDEKPTFIIQQRLGEYYFNIYLLKEVIEHALKTPSPVAKRIAIYDRDQKKIISQIVREDQSNRWQSSPPADYISQTALAEDTNPLLMKVKLTNLTNVQLILVANPNSLPHLSILHIVIIGLLLLSLSFFAYYYLHRLISHHFSLHRAIRYAIKKNNFFPVYQPIFDISTNNYCGIEVLSRWRIDNDEIITPDFFIEEAEQSGLIVPMSLQLVEKALKECQNLLHTNTDFHIAINLSAVHFSNNHFFDSFYTLCRKFQIPPQQITLELTERDLLTQEDTLLINKMNELRLAGFSLAVDDFGTGYASIGYLQHFPFNYLKIDQLFVRAIGTGAITETLNQSIIRMAKDLELHIIAEGVETYVQREFLQAQGVTLMQGWYFANAMPIEQLIPFFKRSVR